ncbi:MAG: biopolymer transporter ExbD [Planctomycetota bacterium]
MRFTRGRATRARRLADLTPMVDVVLQLIIFFMYTSAFSQFTREPINLPAQRGEGGEATGDLVLDIDELGNWSIDGTRVTPVRLGEITRLEAERLGIPLASLEILVRADRDLSAHNLNAAANAFAELGVRRWRLGAQAGGTE